MTAPRSFGFSTTAEASEEAVKTNATFKNWILTLGAMIVVAACSGEAAPVYFAGPILEGSGPNGELALDGAVVNDSAQAAAYVQVTFILYNEDGQVVETLTELVPVHRVVFRCLGVATDSLHVLQGTWAIFFVPA